MTLRLRIISVAAGVICLAAAMPVHAAASHVQCGDLVTQSVQLDSDLVDCSGDGLVVGADGISIDLNGHMIDGSGTGDGLRLANRHRVTVTDGTVREFGAGLRLGSAAENELSALHVDANGGPGLFLLSSSRNLLTGLTVTGNGHSTFGEGVLVISGSDDNVVRESAFSGNAFVGLRITNSSRNRITRNDLDDGILLFGGSFESVVSRNHVHDAPQDGIGMGVGGNTGNRLERNVVSSAGRDGISVGFSEGTTVRGNRVRASGADGVFVAQSGDTVIEGNRTNRNGDDGIDTTDPSTVVTRNHADRNFDFGIEAVPGTIDGGGNRARGNGNPAQCLNIACR